MNVFGVGGAELVAILVIMLIFAGPKRMIHWSYVLGTYLSKFRVIWSQTVDLVQKEFDEAGVDIKLPKEPPTRKNLNRAITDAVKPVTKPVQDSIDEVKKDVGTFQELSDALNDKKPKVKAAPSQQKDQEAKIEPDKPVDEVKPASPEKSLAPAKVPEAGPANLGSWSGKSATNAPDTSANGKSVDLGTWSASAIEE